MTKKNIFSIQNAYKYFWNRCAKLSMKSNSRQTRHFSLVINSEREKYRAIKTESAKNKFMNKFKHEEKERKSSHGTSNQFLLVSIKFCFLFKEIKKLLHSFREFMNRECLTYLRSRVQGVESLH